MALTPGANLTARNRLAQMLMQQEQAALPIQAHSQGLASMLRQGLAGYMQGADVRDRAQAYRTMLEGMQAKPWVNPDTGQVSAAPTGGYAGAETVLSRMGGNEYAAELIPQMAGQRMALEQQRQLADESARRDYEYGMRGAREKSELELQQMADPRYIEGMRQRAIANAEAYGMRPLTPLQEMQSQKLLTEIEKAASERQSQGEAAIFDIDRTIRSAQELKDHPGREMATGASSFMSAIPGTPARGFAAKLETLQSQVFLPEVQKMVGMGALSNAEGQKLASAFASLDPSMPEDEFVAQLNQAIGDLNTAKQRAMTRFGMSGQGQNQMPQPSAQGDWEPVR